MSRCKCNLKRFGRKLLQLGQWGKQRSSLCSQHHHNLHGNRDGCQRLHEYGSSDGYGGAEPSGNGTVATVSNTGLVTAVSFGTATITFTNNNGCTTTTTINVTNPTAPTFNPIAAVCSGGNIQLPAASTNNVQGTWSPAVNNTQTTTYTFTPAAGQCATTAQLTVNVNALPNINAGLDQSVCQGASATLTASGGNSYSWDNGVSNGVAFVPNATTTYTVTGTDANGCTNTDQVTVTVVPNPAVTGPQRLRPYPIRAL
ncbi:MAG: hypothetical protein EB023_04305 [Flavobacteriia bacterium]|nr:hypothetical protein [Flavobacteriia bacterium]